MRTLLIFAAISLTFANILLAEPIFPFHLGGSFAKTSREPKFNIELHPEDSPYLPEDDEEAVVMPNNDGNSYRCYLPKVEKAKTGKPVSQVNLSSMVMESVKKVELKTPDELLEGLKDQCFVRQEGWWSYEFCYEKRMRQVHLENDLIVQEFILGVFDAEATAAINENLSDVSMIKDPRSKDAAQRYHPHQYKNGTICDLTNQPRETEVRFVCSEPRTMISSITELSTCKYAVTIRSPMLCQHPLFQAERPVLYTIHCNVIHAEAKEANMAEDLKDQKIVALTDIEDASEI